MNRHVRGIGYQGYNFYISTSSEFRKQTRALYEHRIFASCFIPNPNNYEQVNHINGNKSDNSLLNLEWLSKSLNQIHAFKTGLQQAGEGHGQAVLKESDMDTIFGLRAQGYSYQKIANHLNVGMATISDIIKRRTWTTVTDKYFL